MDILTQLFLLFLKVNLLSTSGPASVGLLYHEVVAGKLVTESQFVQAVGLSSVLPGSDALQLAMYIGYAIGGIPGGLVALVNHTPAETSVGGEVIAELCRTATTLAPILLPVPPSIDALVLLSCS